MIRCKKIESCNLMFCPRKTFHTKCLLIPKALLIPCPAPVNVTYPMSCSCKCYLSHVCSCKCYLCRVCSCKCYLSHVFFCKCYLSHPLLLYMLPISCPAPVGVIYPMSCSCKCYRSYVLLL